MSELFTGLSTRVATVGSLIALKVLARDDVSRPQDRVDLLALLRVASATDIDEAGHLCSLIEARGYERGRDLQGSLRSIQREIADGRATADRPKVV